jgi:pilus assembly protein CpaE
MRLAMRAGARDFLPENASEADFIASVLRIQEETLRARSVGLGKLIVVANGKGGSGASFLATNLAHSLVIDGDNRVTLVDLDLQFGGLSRYLDITPKVGILQAIDAAGEIDEMSAQAYTHEHSSGLRILAAPAKHLASANNISIEKLETVLEAYLSINDYIVADSPARLDPVTELFFERADKIVLITQQSLPHVHDSARLLYLLTSEIGVPKKHITVVVNRFSKNAAITIADIQKALRTKALITIPNHYKIASESINSGIPVAEISKTAALSRGIRKLQVALSDPVSQPSPGFLKRAMPNFLGG